LLASTVIDGDLTSTFPSHSSRQIRNGAAGRHTRTPCFNPLQSGVLDDVAAELSQSPEAVALAWLLHQSANILLIPGTSSVAHLQENPAAASVELTEDALTKLNGIAA